MTNNITRNNINHATITNEQRPPVKSYIRLQLWTVLCRPSSRPMRDTLVTYKHVIYTRRASNSFAVTIHILTITNEHFVTAPLPLLRHPPSVCSIVCCHGDGLFDWHVGGDITPMPLLEAVRRAVLWEVFLFVPDHNTTQQKHTAPLCMYARASHNGNNAHAPLSSCQVRRPPSGNPVIAVHCDTAGCITSVSRGEIPYTRTMGTRFLRAHAQTIDAYCRRLRQG